MPGAFAKGKKFRGHIVTHRTRSGFSIEPQDGGFLLTSCVRLPRPRAEVFPFHTDARNLDRLTPRRLRFRVLTPDPIEMRAGLHIDYRLWVRWIPIRWQSEITVWDPPKRFVDEQRRGPYRWWKHEHTFVEANNNTLVTDRVHYGVPGGDFIHNLFVRRNLEQIFAFRTAKLIEIFAPKHEPGDPFWAD